jgi:predicted ATPase with chaperone activity
LKRATIQVEAPQRLAGLGVSRNLIEELALKLLFLNGEMSLADLANQMCVTLPVIEAVFQFFRREQLCDVKGMIRGIHVITLSGLGKERASAAQAHSSYSGPAPVSLEDYTERVREQSVQRSTVGPRDLRRAFRELVLDDDLVTRLGTAVISGTSLFLYGPSGTGKTTLARKIPSIYGDLVLIPYAIEVDHQIIAVYDPGVHQAVEVPYDSDSDRRWVVCRRPRVIAGGELSAEVLDLQFSRISRFFTAPLQLKANNGVLVLDDFGRQRMRPEELLNRWMTPLDSRIDFLTLTGGKKFEVPFDVLVIFATNMDPRALTDEAFLRRIPNKVGITYATSEQFATIFQRECAGRGLACDSDLATYVVDVITKEMQQPLSHSHAGDIVNQIFWSAIYRGIEPRLTRDTLREACRSYFLPVART